MSRFNSKIILPWLRIAGSGPISWYYGFISMIAIIYFKFVLLKKVIGEEKKSPSVVKKILGEVPFYCIFVSIFIGMATHELILNKLALWLAVFGLLNIAYRTLWFAHNPFFILDFIFNHPAVDFKNLISRLAEIKLNKMTKAQLEELFKIAKSDLPKISGNFARNPKLALIFFLPYFLSSVVFTVLLFAVIIRATVLNDGACTMSNAILASASRFFQGPEIIQANSKMLQTILVVESMMSFFFIIIAIFSFSSLLNRSLDDLGDKVEKVVLQIVNGVEEKVLLKMESEL